MNSGDEFKACFIGNNTSFKRYIRKEKSIFIFGKTYSVRFYRVYNPNNDGYIPKYYILNEYILFSDDEFKKYFKTIEEIREEKLNKLIK